MQSERGEAMRARRSRMGVCLDAIGWLLFFAWIGVILFIKGIPDGAGALGVSAIILCGTLARLLLRVSVSFFWVIIGALFLAAGIGEFLKVQLPLLPLALIVCGILLLLHRRSSRHGG